MLDVNRERLAGYRRCQAFGGRENGRFGHMVGMDEAGEEITWRSRSTAVFDSPKSGDMNVPWMLGLCILEGPESPIVRSQE